MNRSSLRIYFTPWFNASDKRFNFLNHNLNRLPLSLSVQVMLVSKC